MKKFVEAAVAEAPQEPAVAAAAMPLLNSSHLRVDSELEVLSFVTTMANWSCHDSREFLVFFSVAAKLRLANL